MFNAILSVFINFRSTCSCFLIFCDLYLQELETVTNTYEQLQTEKDDTVKKLQKLESGYKRMEKEKNELIQVSDMAEKLMY